MKHKKIYRAEVGIQIDDCFANHVYNCATCKQFDAAKPASVALMCHEGSVLWKRENGVKVTKEREERSETFASKAEVKKAMRYK